MSTPLTKARGVSIAVFSICACLALLWVGYFIGGETASRNYIAEYEPRISAMEHIVGTYSDAIAAAAPCVIIIKWKDGVPDTTFGCWKDGVPDTTFGCSHIVSYFLRAPVK